MELMDQASINAVEDYQPMGLDRDGRRAADRPVRRAGRRLRGGDRGDGGRLHGGRGHRGVRHRRPGGGRDVRRGPAGRLPGHRGPRGHPARGRRRPGPAAAGAAGRRSPPSRRSTSSRSRWWPTPATATPIRSWCSTRPTPTARDRAHLAFDEIMALAIALGGTITGEHGVGRTKKELLPAQLGPRVMALNRQIKQRSTRRASSTRAPSTSWLASRLVEHSVSRRNVGAVTRPWLEHSVIRRRIVAVRVGMLVKAVD